MQISRRHVPFALAAGLGLAYAPFAHDAYTNAPLPDSSLLRFPFLLALLVGLGAVTAHFTPEASRETSAGHAGWRLCWAPFLVVLTFSFAALLFHLQAFLGVLLFFPAFLIPATTGAHVYASLLDLRPPKDGKF